jgi:hypothetical protein
MKYLPTDVSSFKLLISGNYIYVDKTEYIYNLFQKGSRYYFLSRPRRFGKTLLASTLKELFLGNRELFKGLWINNSDWDWQEHPVLYFDFSSVPHATVEEFKSALAWRLDSIAQLYQLGPLKAPNVENKLEELILQLSKLNKVVILIDEYDKPILDHLKNIEEAKAQRNVLKSFYDVLKGVEIDEKLRAIFITGVTKFAKTSLFSGLNNLNDITMKPEAAALLGYTTPEINRSFSNYLMEIIEREKRSPEAIMLDIKNWYNGYRFSEQEIRVYNPFSLLYYLKDGILKNFWYESGTPSFLINLIRSQYQQLEDIQDIEIDTDSLGTFDIEHIPLTPLLFQTGYLTLSSYNETTKKYKLAYPNFEVELSFKRFLVTTLTQASRIEVETTLTRLIAALQEVNIESFCRSLETLLAHIPYTLRIKREAYYHSLFQLIMSLISLEAHSEVVTNRGRIDTVLIMNEVIYLFELKCRDSAEKALQQIRDRKYYERYRESNKRIVLVGLFFNMQEEFSVEYRVEEA